VAVEVFRSRLKKKLDRELENPVTSLVASARSPPPYIAANSKVSTPLSRARCSARGKGADAKCVLQKVMCMVANKNALATLPNESFITFSSLPDSHF
jgi:hypothetical protein